MGMFTTVIHPDDGRELQINTWLDKLGIYEVGDSVDWYIDEACPREGRLLDGVYASYSDRGPDDWVVIKDHKIHAVAPRTIDQGDEYQDLMNLYEVHELPDSAWPDEAWEKMREIREKVMDPNYRPMSYAEIARRVIRVDPMPEGWTVDTEEKS